MKEILISVLGECPVGLHWLRPRTTYRTETKLAVYRTVPYEASTAILFSFQVARISVAFRQRLTQMYHFAAYTYILQVGFLVSMLSLILAEVREVVSNN